MTIKTCTQCKTEKPMTEFYKKLKVNTSACKACINAKMAAQRAADPDGTRAKASAWNSTNRGKSRAWAAAWYWANRERSLDKSAARRRANPEDGYARVVAWRREHIDVCAATNAARRAQKLKATPEWANQDAILEMYSAAAARTLATGRLWTVDHIVPLKSNVVCGLHVVNNLQLLPHEANSAK